MLQVIPKSKALAVLSALVVVGMWTNAIAAVFPLHHDRREQAIRGGAERLIQPGFGGLVFRCVGIDGIEQEVGIDEDHR